MTDAEKYLFDLQGYLTVPDALSPQQLQTLNALLDEHIAADMGEKTTHRFGGLLHWGQPLLNLLDNERIVPHLEALLGHKFRLDHVYSDIIRGGQGPVQGPIGATLHGGATPFDPSQYYQYSDGKMHSGLLVVAYNLHDVNEGDGGFACVPGSHKANFRIPEAWKNLEHLQPCVTPVVGPAGTAILFTEALTHGTLPWRGQHERRTIFFKYSPHHMSWSKKYFDANEYEGLSERQRVFSKRQMRGIRIRHEKAASKYFEAAFSFDYFAFLS